MAVLLNTINQRFVWILKKTPDPDKMDNWWIVKALQEKIDALGAWEIDTKLEIAMDALRTPDGDTPIKKSFLRRASSWFLYVVCYTNQTFCF
jgi:hypothetical protein